MKAFYTLLILSICAFAKAQVTLIPDQNFEQELIDQNIDSDGLINGQVLTSDIDNLNDLNLGFYVINDLTGLQDFSQLKNLTIDNLSLPSNTDQFLDLTANIMLETLIMNGGDDAFTHDIKKIDLSENLNINQIQTTGIWPLRQIDLKTGSTDVSNLNINISIAPNDLVGDTNEEFNQNLFCIKVTDETAATAGTGVYSSWTISADNNPYYFSETCTLSTDEFRNVDVSIYPNPTTAILNIEANIQLESIKIFNLQGKLVKEFKDSITNFIDVSEMAIGLYILQIESEYGILKKKFLKQ
jgi:hypothetical protein